MPQRPGASPPFFSFVHNPGRGATIDAVTLGRVTLQWGLAGGAVANAPAKAVRAALDMLGVRRRGLLRTSSP